MPPRAPPPPPWPLPKLQKGKRHAPTHTPARSPRSTGGVVVASADGRIVCSNTLEDRLRIAYAQVGWGLPFLLVGAVAQHANALAGSSSFLFFLSPPDPPTPLQNLSVVRGLLFGAPSHAS